jgi:vacuolar-type H+-ATPase subunit H
MDEKKIESMEDLEARQQARRIKAEETARETVATARKAADELIALAQQEALKLIMEAAERASALVDVAYKKAEVLMEEERMRARQLVLDAAKEDRLAEEERFAEMKK